MSSEWIELPVEGELDLSLTLSSGQAFRWRLIEAEGVWVGTLGCYVFALKSPSPSTLSYQVLHPPSSQAHTSTCAHPSPTPTDTLTDYFQLGKDLSHLYMIWSKCDANFERKSPQYQGVRLLQQDPLENLLSFICSSNNSITRISQMINNLCNTLGDHLCCYGDVQLYGFPELQALCCQDTERVLRGMGFGYRARYVADTCKALSERGGRDWLLSLRLKPYEEVWSTLQSLPGVGAKVADCIAMMSLNKPEAVPIDTHMLAIATRDYGFVNKHKTLTAKVYRQIGDHFREVFGEQAGWATTVLFVADLGKSGANSKSEGRGKRKISVSEQTNAKKLKT